LETRQGNIPTYLIIMILIMGAFGVMGGGLIAPALPAIGEAFAAPDEQIGLVLSIYTLAAALSLPLTGYLLDAVGRRKVGLACLIIDGTAGLAIIFTTSFPAMLVLRFVQGIGIAGLIPVAMTIIGDLFQKKRRLQVMGYLTGTISLGAVVIPSIGGFLASVDWRLVFAVYGFSLLLALFFFGTLPETSEKHRKKGSKTTSAESPRKYLASLFSVLKITEIRNLMIHSLIIYFLLYALVTFIPLYLVIGHGFTEIFTGLALSLQGLFSALLASQAGFIADFLSWRLRAAAGFALIALGFILLPFWPEGSYLLSASFIIYGTGMGMVSPTIYNRATGLPPANLTGSVIAIFNTMKFVGMTLAPLILGLIFAVTGLETIFIGVGIGAALWGFITLRPLIAI